MKTQKSKFLIPIIIAVVIISIIIGLVAGFAILNANEKDAVYESIYTEWANSIPEEQPEFLNALDEMSSFECVDITEEPEDYFTVTVTTTSPNISEALDEYQQQVFGEELTEEEMNESLCDIIHSAPTETTEHLIYVVKDSEGAYHVNFSESFIDAMFGYAYIDSMETLNEELEELVKGE